MKEHPILFSGEMVRAILDGRKTTTRRVIPEKVVDAYYEYDSYCRAVMPHDVPCYRDYEKSFFMSRSRYGIFDRLYVRETFCECNNTDEGACTCYRADNNTCDAAKWTPSIHMPRSASRITLEVTNVRVERVQDISEEDATAGGFNTTGMHRTPHAVLRSFRLYWDSINANRPGCSWDDNPWVWCIEFKRI